MKLKTAIALTATLGISFLSSAVDIDPSKLPPPSDKKDLTFEKDIKPLFDKSCVECHGAVKPKGKLRLDTLEGTLKGSVDGKVLEAGKSEKFSGGQHRLPRRRRRMDAPAQGREKIS